MTIIGVYLLLVAHFIGDFLLQTDKMAINKSKSFKWLAYHCLVYASCFAAFQFGVVFAWITFVLHFITDAITSRITSKLWFIHKVDHDAKLGLDLVEYLPTRHWFFVMIGFDQLIHGVTLLWTYQLLNQYLQS